MAAIPAQTTAVHSIRQTTLNFLPLARTASRPPWPNSPSRLSPRNPTPYFSSSAPVQAPAAIISPLPSMSTPPPMPPPPSIMTAPPCPTLVQPFTAPLLTPHPMPAAYLPDLEHTRASVSCNKLVGTVAPYDRATTPNGKDLEGRNMMLFKIGTEYHGPTMVACKHQQSRRNRPWDPGIDFRSHCLKPQHLEDKCCRELVTQHLALYMYEGGDGPSKPAFPYSTRNILVLSLRAHGCHTSFNYRNPHHPLNRAPMAAFHGCHSSPNHCSPQHSPNHLELSPASEDRLETALAKLTLSQLNLVAIVDTLVTTIDNFLQRLSPRNPTPQFSSSKATSKEPSRDSNRGCN
ncbi:hypothetical protein HKD37_18G049956 [Glycine soja]